MLKSKNRLGVSLHSRRRMWEFHRRAEERGHSLPVAVTLGIHPLHYMGSMVYSYPPQVRKYEIIGGLFGEPYMLAKCGVQDLEVPVGAEIIIEGEILPHVKEPEGPFSEFTGYASYRSTQNVFVAHRIRMRRDAMYHSVASGMSKDHILISCVTREGEILNSLKRNLPNVIGVHVPHTTCGAFMAFIKIKKTAQGEPQQAILAALGTEFYTKHVIVVDDDIDIFDVNDVMWAVATRVRPETDIFFIPGCKGAVLDPTSDPETFTLTKMGIDATRPQGKDFAERLIISEEQRQRTREILRKSGVALCAGSAASTWRDLPMGEDDGCQPIQVLHPHGDINASRHRGRMAAPPTLKQCRQFAAATADRAAAPELPVRHGQDHSWCRTWPLPVHQSARH